jgi:ribosome-associated protein
MSEPVSAEPAPAGDSIELDRFLKLAHVVQSGGEAKLLIRSGAVLVNGVAESRRGRKLKPGDTVHVHGEDYVIESDGQ